METGELRVKNLVLHNGVETEVTDICCEENQKEINCLGADDFTGIELTEEWLERFGFEFIKSLINGESWETRDYYKSDGVYGIKLSKGLNNPECFYFFHVNTGLKIQHVHSLQNLYFALTNTELNDQTTED